MTLLGWLATFFPITHLLLISACAIWFVHSPGVVPALTTFAITYLLPPCILQIYSLKYPTKSGRFVINQKGRCDWWIAHQLQMMYTILPFLEAFLRLMPGVYSAWLRLWGSTVGKRVYWTPLVTILDRPMLIIGDDVVFGHKVVCTSHAINKKENGDMVLILKHTQIGSKAFLGALARIGPGVKVPENEVVAYDSEYRFQHEKLE